MVHVKATFDTFLGHQVIWNNKYITGQKISLFEKHLLSKGIVTIGDLISDSGIFLKGVKVLHANSSLFVNKRLNPSNIYFSTAMLQRPSGKLSVLGLVNVKLTFKHLQ